MSTIAIRFLSITTLYIEHLNPTAIIQGTALFKIGIIDLIISLIKILKEKILSYYDALVVK